MTDLYGVLGVGRGTDDATLKATYRRLARASHPDFNAGDDLAAERFKAVNLAYETLGDPEARAAYDQACAAERSRRRRELRGVVATMSASFVLTVVWGVFTAMWLLGV